MSQSSDTIGVSSNEKTSEELPAENYDEQCDISTSTSSCSGTYKNLYKPPYPEVQCFCIFIFKKS